MISFWVDPSKIAKQKNRLEIRKKLSNLREACLWALNTVWPNDVLVFIQLIGGRKTTLRAIIIEATHEHEFYYDFWFCFSGDSLNSVAT